MKAEILTLFPELFDSFLSTSLIGKAVENGQLEYNLVNIRTFAESPHYHVDDTPYGGGPGMVLKPEPVAAAIRAAKANLPNAPVIFPSPAGKVFSQQKAEELSQSSEMILLCGRYEGIDQRVIDSYVDLEISLGDYVLMGGELPAMVILESTVRLIKNVVGNQESLIEESFSSTKQGLLEAPHYTRPAEFEGISVPEVLLSGDHEKIKKWREKQSLARTRKIRPDLLRENP